MQTASLNMSDIDHKPEALMSTTLGPVNAQIMQPLASSREQNSSEALLTLQFYLEGTKQRLQSLSFPKNADGWLLDLLAQEFNSVFDRLMEIDTDYHISTTDQSELDVADFHAVETEIIAILDKWLTYCDGLFPVSEPSLPAVRRLHANIREAKAMRTPRSEIGGQILGYQNAAIQAHKAGDSADLLEGLQK
jgi:hypothetical protein